MQQDDQPGLAGFQSTTFTSDDTDTDTAQANADRVAELLKLLPAKSVNRRVRVTFNELHLMARDGLPAALLGATINGVAMGLWSSGGLLDDQQLAAFKDALAERLPWSTDA